ncbi:MAG: ester cyclase [Actinomycetota bacterium]|nr:ester cyclase [Actinomycetota bacterium]
MRDKADVARRLVTDVFGGGDVSLVDELVDEGLIDHNPFPGLAPGREGFTQAVTMVRGGFPDLRCAPVRVIVDGDGVFYHWEGNATQSGAFAGIPPTGKAVRLSGMEIIHFGGRDDDKVIEHWILVNGMEIMQQLGVVPGASDPLPPYTPVPTVDAGRATTPDENKQVMVRHVEEIWNGKNLDAADELFHPQAVTPYAPLPPGPQGCKVIAGMFHTAFPDFHMTVEDILAEGDLVGARFRQTGTQRGELFGIPPTGKPVDFEEMAVVQIADGKILATWFETDLLTMMQQLGVGQG